MQCFTERHSKKPSCLGSALPPLPPLHYPNSSEKTLNLEVQESPGSCQPESFREAYPPSSPHSLSALPSFLILVLTPIPFPRVPDTKEPNNFVHDLEEKDPLEESKEEEEEWTLNNPIIVEQYSEQPLEEEYVKESQDLEVQEHGGNISEKSSDIEKKDSIEKLKKIVKEAVQGGCDMQARFTVVRKQDFFKYLSFKAGDSIPGGKQTVKPN